MNLVTRAASDYMQRNRSDRQPPIFALFGRVHTTSRRQRTIIAAYLVVNLGRQINFKFERDVAVCRPEIAETMVQPFYAVTQRFGPWSNGWQSYFDWAKIPQIEELVTLDGMLCPPLVDFETAEDWNHGVQVGERFEYADFEYMLKRAGACTDWNLLAVYRNPPRHMDAVPASRKFVFVGYDLIEDLTRISALVNCGGFPESFSNTELNHFGLIDSFDRVSVIRESLAKNNPEEAHAQCEMYAIWRLESDCC